MSTQPSDPQRRSVLQLAAALAATGTATSAAAAATQPAKPAATGKPGDFDFLTGHWKIHHCRLKDQQWDTFEGEATVHGILGGVCSVEELRIPSRNFSGLGLRLLDVERKLWADYWVNATGAILGGTPTWGSFVNGSGTWEAEERMDGKSVLVRGIWDQIAPQSHRWRQAASHDGGHTWEDNWIMEWRRV